MSRGARLRGLTAVSSLVLAVSLGGADVRAAPAQVPVPAPSTSPSPTPPPPPPPPPPQAGTRVLATTVTPGLGVRVVVFESGVAGVDGGWSVTVGARAGDVRGTVRPDAVTITGEGGVPSATSAVGGADRDATLFTVAGQRGGATYRARYLAFGTVTLPAGVASRPVVTTTLIQ